MIYPDYGQVKSRYWRRTLLVHKAHDSNSTSLERVEQYFFNDACGVGFIAHIKGQKSHDIVCKGLEILKNITHRGAVGADPLAGDGAGILIQLPDAFLRAECAASGIQLPAQGEYGVGMIFLPRNTELRASCEKTIEDFILAEGQKLLGWRDVPVENEGLGESVKMTTASANTNWMAARPFTSRPSRRAPWFTKACCWPIRWVSIIVISMMNGW